jgi:phage tail-like protein
MQSVEGGYAKADIAAMNVGADEIPLKHVTNVKFEPIIVHGDVSSLDDFAKRALDKPTPFNGRVIAMGIDRKAISSLEFFNAIPTKVVISDLDASSKEACYIEVTLAPERTRRVEGGAGEGIVASKLQRCLRSNFTVKIPGITTNGVFKVEGLAMTREIAPDNLGVQREVTKHPTKTSVSNVVLTVSEATARDFWNWYDSFLLKGENSQEKEKTIEIQLMGPDMKSSTLTLQGSGVGMVAMRPLSGSGENVARVEVELYVDKWAIGGTP